VPFALNFLPIQMVIIMMAFICVFRCVSESGRKVTCSPFPFHGLGQVTVLYNDLLVGIILILYVFVSVNLVLLSH